MQPDPGRGVAAIYVRISQDREGAGLGIDRQTEDCRPLCARRGYSVETTRVYADNDISAYSGKRRPQYEAMLRDITAGEVGFVAVWHTDRLHRRTRELDDFIDIVHPRGVDVEAARAGTIDLSTPAGRAVAKTLCAWSQYESEHKAERISRQKRQQREKGLPHGGPRPFGWARRVHSNTDGTSRETWDPMRHDPVEAALIRAAVGDLLQGGSLAEVARHWREIGVGQPQTGLPKWTTDAVRQVVSNPRNAGLVGHRVEMQSHPGLGRYRRYSRPVVVGAAVWPPIIDPELWTALQTLLARRAGPATPKRRSLLTHLVVCGNCGMKMVRASDRGGRSTYRCPSGGLYTGCGRVSADARGVEELVVEAVMYAVDGPGLAKEVIARERQGTEPRFGRLTAQLREVDTRLQLAAEGFAEGRLSAGSYERATALLEKDRDDLGREVAKFSETSALEPYLGGDGVLRHRWPTLGLDVRRAVLSSILDAVTIGPAERRLPRFDPDRVALRWKS